MHLREGLEDPIKSQLDCLEVAGSISNLVDVDSDGDSQLCRGLLSSRYRNRSVKVAVGIRKEREGFDKLPLDCEREDSTAFVIGGTPDEVLAPEILGAVDGITRMQGVQERDKLGCLGACSWHDGLLALRKEHVREGQKRRFLPILRPPSEDKTLLDIFTLHHIIYISDTLSRST